MFPLRQVVKLINLGVHLKSYRQYCNVSKLGSGAGKGGGAGGSIREAGGRMGETGAAAEEVYFRKKDAELVEKIKKKTLEDIEYHKELIAMHKAAKDGSESRLEQIKRHEEAIQKNQKVIDELSDPK